MDIILRINRNYFLKILISVIILSFSLAYLSSVLFRFLFLKNTAIVNTSKSTPKKVYTIPPKKDYSEYESLITGNLFQLSIKAKGSEEIAQEIKDIELLGVISGSPQIARALIKQKDNNLIKEYAIGEIAAGNKILNIYFSSILILRGNREMILKVGEDTSKAIDKTQTSVDTPATRSENIATIKRSRVIQLTQNQTQLYENKFTPITKDGKILGIKMVFIPTNNFLYELGARSGDIIRRINGQPLDNMNKLIELWQNIQTLNKISVEVERGGKIIPFEILIQD